MGLVSYRIKASERVLWGSRFGDQAFRCFRLLALPAKKLLEPPWLAESQGRRLCGGLAFPSNTSSPQKTEFENERIAKTEPLLVTVSFLMSQALGGCR